VFSVWSVQRLYNEDQVGATRVRALFAVPSLHWQRRCIYCANISTRVTCRTVNSMYLPGTGILTTDYVECRHVKLWMYMVCTTDYDRGEWQTSPLVREGVPHWQKCKYLTVTKIWSWAPEGAGHQDWLANWPSVVMRLWVTKIWSWAPEGAWYQDWQADWPSVVMRLWVIEIWSWAPEGAWLADWPSVAMRLWVTKIWCWAPEGAWHQDWLADGVVTLSLPYPSAYFFLRFLFDPEDGICIFLRNVGRLSPDVV
jgi:hypothetical protein